MAPVRVHPAAGVRDDERPRAQGVHHAHREGDLLQVIALVAVEPSLHRHHRPAAEAPEQQPARVGLDGGEREAGDLAVGHLGLDRDLAGKPAQAGAEDDPDLRRERAPPAHLRGRGLDPIVQRCRHRHARSPNSTVPSLIIVAPSSTATG